MISNKDVLDEGFKPLVKTKTEPQPLPSKPFLSKGMSFNAETGEKESSQSLWEDSSWEKMGRSRGRTMDKAMSFVGAGPAESKALREEVIVVVDPFSTGAHLAAAVTRAGYRCARVLSSWDSPVAALVQQGLIVDYCASIQYNDRLAEPTLALNETIAALQSIPFKIIAIIPGAETGVELADQLSYHMKLRTNGIEKSVARRNKYFMGESVRNAGVRAVKQALCNSKEEVLRFIQQLKDDAAASGAGSTRCVVKPVQSAGSDDVFLCNNEDEALTAFDRIFGTCNGIGVHNDNVLVQEFLVGKEYVVDKVSLDGKHKVVAIWEYDKRKINNAAFVYFGVHLISSYSKKAQVMIEYADKVLDALEIKHGPSHMEIMLDTRPNPDDPNGEPEYLPCLVEVGARCHGGEGTWLPIVNECIGYSQVDVTLDVYLEGKLFNTIEKGNLPLKKSGVEVELVSRNGGVVRRLPGDAFVRQLASFRGINWEVKPGDYLPKTIDCFTSPGRVQLVHEDPKQLENDFNAIHDFEELGMIDYSVICPKPPSIGAVVVVDPFSSGANLAAMILLWGYKLILVFSEKDSPVAKLVTKGSKVEPTLLVQHDNLNPNQDAALKATLEAIDSQGAPILAIIPGAETGVQLADHLANRYGTRCNSEELTAARRDKYLMQEYLRKQGKIRTVQQRLCRSEEELAAFLNDLKTKSPTGSVKCVLKPNQSAGTDSVYLCNNEDEANTAFHYIHGQINGLGQLNDGALCQEFLSGVEYVVDGVSRDGVYKIIAIWEYDKRSVNNANFVYFGMTLRDASDPKVRAVVEYAKQVVSGLRIHHGPSHMEIICTEVTNPSLTSNEKQYSPCLVEVGTRCHGGEATWHPVAMECIGYTQLDATLNCYLRADRFDALPFEPKLVKFGWEAFLVSHAEGHLKDIPGMEVIRNLQSFRRMEMLTQPGAHIAPTIDCFTRPGSVQLVNSSLSQLERDYEEIRRLEKDGLFELI